MNTSANRESTLLAVDVVLPFAVLDTCTTSIGHPRVVWQPAGGMPKSIAKPVGTGGGIQMSRDSACGVLTACALWLLGTTVAAAQQPAAPPPVEQVSFGPFVYHLARGELRTDAGRLLDARRSRRSG